MLDTNWQPPASWPCIRTIDMHTGGEPLRVIIDGFPKLTGNSILDYRRQAKEEYDHLRKALMWEPRGHFNMYGCIMVPATTDDADFGVLFTHNEGFSSMCGHGIIAMTKLVLETGYMAMKAPITTVKINSPAGLITAHARIENNHVSSVYFHNVPSFVVDTDNIIDVPGIGEVKYDLAFSGAFYAYIQAESIGLGCTENYHSQLIEKGRLIKQAIMASRTIEHPFEKDLGFLYGCIFIGPNEQEGAHSRNVCVFANGEIDRSPTGTGVSGRVTVHCHKGEVALNESIVIESITGSRFTATVREETQFGPYKAYITEVEGNAYITGKHEFYLDPDDKSFPGFLLE